MTVLRRWVDALWPLAMLLVFLVMFRRSAPDARSGDASAACERRISDGPPQSADVARFERCLALDPSNVELMTDLGAAYESSARAGLAEAMYRRALQVDPRAGDLHVRLGGVLLAHGDSWAARAEAEAALRSQPGSPAARALLERSSGAAAEAAR